MAIHAAKQTWVEIVRKVFFQHQGKPLPHFFLAPIPQMLAYKFPVLVALNDTASGKRTLGKRESPVGIFRKTAIGGTFPAYLQKHAFPCRQVFLVRVFLKDEQIAAHLNAARLHEKAVWQAQSRNDMRMAHQIIPYEPVAQAVGHAP